MAKQIDDAKHVLREIRLMRYLGVHENIISLEDLIIKESSDELYIVMELLDSDLHRVIQSKQVLTENHFKYFFFQLLCGVKFLHDNRIIHRDLKPGNILVTRDCKLRITDFGLARERPTGLGPTSDDHVEEPMTEHVITRWYRPPELMLCPDGLYTYAVDMWSCGCILGEMLGRNPMFPGKNFIHQLTLIFDVIGSPKQSEIKHIKNNQAIKFLNSQISKSKIVLSTLFPNVSYEAIHMVESLLQFNPDKRATADEALKSIYMNNVGKDSKSLEFPVVSKKFEFNFEKMKLTKNQLKNLIINDAKSFHQEKYNVNDSNEILETDNIIKDNHVNSKSNRSLSANNTKKFENKFIGVMANNKSDMNKANNTAMDIKDIHNNSNNQGGNITQNLSNGSNLFKLQQDNNDKTEKNESSKIEVDSEIVKQLLAATNKINIGNNITSSTIKPVIYDNTLENHSMNVTTKIQEVHNDINDLPESPPRRIKKSIIVSKNSPNKSITQMNETKYNYENSHDSNNSRVYQSTSIYNRPFNNDIDNYNNDSSHDLFNRQTTNIKPYSTGYNTTEPYRDDSTSTNLPNPPLPPQPEQQQEQINNPIQNNKKRITIAKSPKFSLMSWERKLLKEHDNNHVDNNNQKGIPAKKLGKRAISASRYQM